MPWTYLNYATGRYAGSVRGKSGLHYHAYGPDSYQISSMLLGQEGHYGYPRFPDNSNVGGLFRMEKNYVTYDWVNIGQIYRFGGNIDNETYTGSVTADGGASPWTMGLYDASPWGANAFSRMKPAQPQMAGLNAIYELKDLPQMLRQRHSKIRDIGNYYLALEFGWKPLLRDIVNFINTQMDAQDYLNQLLRDNGKAVRRKLTLFNSSVTSAPQFGSGYGAMKPILPTQYYAGVPTFQERTTTRDRVWASARFRYFLPPGPRDINWTRRMKAKIFGFEPSPAVLWNAIPWSWLIDWCANVGDVIDNLNNGLADRLAAEYFYIMRERTEDTERSVLMQFARQSGEVFQTSSTCHSIRKSCHRVNGNPFGFALQQQPLSGSQLAILGALGLSRI